MATVYLGKLSEPGGGLPELAALKVIKDEFSTVREFVDMFLDEASLVTRLSHPGIVRVYATGREGNRLYYAMELLLGQSLWEVWDVCRMRKSRLRYDMLAWVGARAAEALHHAHELRGPAGEPLGLVHRDVTPSNVLLTYDGELKLIDFGLAKARGRVARTAGGVVKGKLAYMSPEQAASAPVDRRTDVFALGIMLWEMSTDRRLFKRKDNVSTLLAVHEARVPDPTTLVMGYPRPLWRVVRRALQKDPARRYRNAAEMAVDLDACARLEGRELGAADVAEVMQTLFACEAERRRAWVAEASARTRVDPVPPMQEEGAPAVGPEDSRRAARPGLLA